MTQIGTTQDNLLEQMHNEYLSKVTETGMPIWYLDLYSDSSYMYSIGEEVNRNRETPVSNANQHDSNTLPF